MAMNRQDVINILKTQKLESQSKGITALYIFGSYARDEADEFSDVDVAIEYKRPFDLLDLIGYERMLSEKLEIDVDVIPREGLHKLDEFPENDVIQIF